MAFVSKLLTKPGVFDQVDVYWIRLITFLVQQTLNHLWIHFVQNEARMNLNMNFHQNQCKKWSFTNQLLWKRCIKSHCTMTICFQQFPSWMGISWSPASIFITMTSFWAPWRLKSPASFNRLFRRRSTKTPKLRVAGLCEGNSPVTGVFSAQRVSTAENGSIWRRHHDPSSDYTFVVDKTEYQCYRSAWVPSLIIWMTSH